MKQSIQFKVRRTIAFILTAVLLMGTVSLAVYADEEYYGDEIESLTQSTVQDSEGNWVTSGGYYDPNWQNYNCYAYAIQRVEQPHYHIISRDIQYTPGDISRTASALDSGVFVYAERAKSDLEIMGYEVDEPTTVCPSVDETQELICVRTTASGSDYHFMRYNLADNSWYHKPWKGAVMKFNSSTLSNSVAWVDELSIEGKEYERGEDYTSDIVYIRYQKQQINVSATTSAPTQTEFIDPLADIFYEVNIGTATWYNLQLTSTSGRDIEYDLYDEDFNIVQSGSGLEISDVVTIAVGKYYLRINFDGNGTGNVYISISHTHEFDRWENYSSTHHIEQCLCGTIGTETEAHVVVAPPSTDVTKVRCLSCGAWVTISGGIIPTPSLSLEKVTLNGSYIRPDGIIVLVEEDVEAYLAGTLVFYNKDDLPQID